MQAKENSGIQRIFIKESFNNDKFYAILLKNPLTMEDLEAAC